MKISPNWPYEDQNKYWAVFCLSKVKKTSLRKRTSTQNLPILLLFFAPLLVGAPAILPIKTNWKIGKRPPATGMRPKR